MKKNIMIGFLAFILLASAVAMIPNASAAPAENTNTFSPLPVDRHWAGTVCYNDKIYIFGGWTDFNWATPPPATVLIYDSGTGTTTLGAYMPVGVFGAQCVMGNDGLVYLIGGWNVSYQQITQIYNPATNSWKSGGGAATPTQVGFGASAVGTDGKIYIFGSGWNWSLTLIYDPVADEYSYGTDIPNDNYGATAVTYNSTAIFLIGGYTSYQDVQVYNPVADSWNTTASLNIGRNAAGSALGRNGYIYVFGGVTGYWSSASQLASIERYDPAEDTWTILSYTLPMAVSGGGSCIDEYGRIFYVGGMSGTAAVDYVQVIYATESNDVVVGITSPTNGATVSDTVTIKAEPIGGMGMFVTFQMIDLYIDNVLVASNLNAFQIAYLWDTSGLPDESSHTILARAFNYDGSISEDTVVVKVSAMSSEDKLDQLELDIAALQSQLDDLKTQLTALNGSMDQTSDELIDQINALQDQLDALQDQLDALQTTSGNANTNASSANTMAMLAMLLTLIAVILIALNIVLSLRKKS